MRDCRGTPFEGWLAGGQLPCNEVAELGGSESRRDTMTFLHWKHAAGRGRLCGDHRAILPQLFVPVLRLIRTLRGAARLKGAASRRSCEKRSIPAVQMTPQRYWGRILRAFQPRRRGLARFTAYGRK